MSNKALIVSIVVVLIIFGGIVYFMRMKNKTGLQDAYNSQSQSTEQAPSSTQNSQSQTQASSTPTSTPDTSMASTTPSTTGECKRDFNENTLKTAKVSIENREVTMNVIDFGTIKLSFY